MSSTITVTLTDQEYQALASQAALYGLSPRVRASQLLTQSLQGEIARQSMTAEQKEATRRAFEACIGSIEGGEYSDADNEKIDADLAREYGRSHEE